MLKILIILSFFSTLSVISQIQIDSSKYDLICYHPKERFVSALGNVKGILPHGKWILFTSNGQIASKGSFKNGKRHGKWRFFDMEGTLMEYGKYKNGMKEGLWTVYEDKYVLFEEGIAIDQNVYK
jgi:antitoxin component YwqK of YwqJK toxin-antitoxin module